MEDAQWRSQSFYGGGAYFLLLPSLFSLSLLLPLFSFLLFTMPNFLRGLVGAPMDNMGRATLAPPLMKTKKARGGDPDDITG